MKEQPYPQILRFVIAVIILILALYGLYALLRPDEPRSAGQTIETAALAPISRGDILEEFRLITVERQYRIPVIGRSYKPLPDAVTGGVLGRITRDILGDRKDVPGTTTNIVYEMVTTVTAGIDLSKVREADIQNDDSTTTLTLPAPEIMAVQHDAMKSRIFAQDSPRLPYMDNSGALLEELQRTGQIKHRLEAQNDDALMNQAQSKAREALERFLEQVHPGRQVQILFHPAKKNLPPG